MLFIYECNGVFHKSISKAEKAMVSLFLRFDGPGFDSSSFLRFFNFRFSIFEFSNFEVSNFEVSNFIYTRLDQILYRGHLALM